MDPNATLAELRSALADVTAAEDRGDSDTDRIPSLELVAMHATHLVEWLDRGGFLPTEWRKAGDR